MLSLDPTLQLRVTLSEGRSYPICFASLQDVPTLLSRSSLRPGRCLLVTDTHVAPLYAAPLEAALTAAGWTPKRWVLPAGEASKSWDVLQRLYDAALTWGIDRKTPILALGGGVVGDLAGFAAATLLRGLPLIQIPTTLVAQVDSAIGGKTGINHAVGKNLIGAFHHPHCVAVDPTTLQTLPEREWTSGLAEVFKHALIADPGFFDFLTTNQAAILARDTSLLPTLLHQAIAIKAEVVGADEREQGRRAILNFGHTFGHAIEAVAGYGHFTHGEAVALGMRAALHLSRAFHANLDYDAATALLDGLPTPPGVAALSLPALMAAMRHDKKSEDGRLRVVLLSRIGHAYVTGNVAAQQIEAAWRALFAEQPGGAAADKPL